MRRATSDGFIVVTVLWVLGAVAALVSIYAVYVIDAAASFGVHEDRLRTEAMVSAALELTAYQASADPCPTHGQFSFRMGQATAAVEFQSETARIDLNVAPKELLSGLFTVLGASDDQANNYANRIIGWRKPPPKSEDSEASAYRSAGLKYAPRGAWLPHVNELSLVLDLPATLVERALPFITVYSGRPQVNVFDAAPQVIAALPGLTRDRLNAVLAARSAEPGNAQLLMRLLGPAQTHVTTEGSNASRVTVRVSFDNGRQMDSQVVILVFKEGSVPFSVLSWHDAERRAHSELKAARR